MEALQPSRPPMSQQPPQRIDGNNNNQVTITNKIENKEADKSQTSPTNNKDIGIPDVDISKAFKRRSLKHRIECGILVNIGKQEIEELSIILGQKKCQMFDGSFNDNISSCVVCDEQCISGEFAVETVLFIPNKNNTNSDNLGRFRMDLPRIACRECSAEYQQENNIIKVGGGNNNDNIKSLGRVWQMHQNGELTQKQTDQSVQQQTQQIQHQHQRQHQHQHQHQNQSSSSLSGINMQQVPTIPAAGGGNIGGGNIGGGNINVGVNDNDDNKIGLPSDQGQSQQISSYQGQQQMNSPNNVHEAERDPFDDGFLICTQLVKTGGADQGGLQVGDVFVEFGHYSKKRFPGLKSIANLVRRSAGKEINVVVWRKLEVNQSYHA